MASMKTITLAIIARNCAKTLPLYLHQLDKQTYPKDLIDLTIWTDGNYDATEIILESWGRSAKYRSFVLNTTPNHTRYDGRHDWTSDRFSHLAKVRQSSLESALKNETDYYFTADTDNFLLPWTLEELVSLNLDFVSPMLRCVSPGRERYSNFHHCVDDRGYFKQCSHYDHILGNETRGIIEVAVAHCTYLIRSSVIPHLTYQDDTGRHEYVVFAESARDNGVQQYLDSRRDYGCLTLDDSATTMQRAEEWVIQ
jgi:hypothetical protein